MSDVGAVVDEWPSRIERVSEPVVRHWSAADWFAREAEWAALVASSGADPLFLSWEWLTQWWRYFGAGGEHSLHILGVYRDARLIGVAPLYRSLQSRGPLVGHSFQFIGLSRRDDAALISEYLDVIARPEDRAAVREA